MNWKQNKLKEIEETKPTFVLRLWPVLLFRTAGGDHKEFKVEASHPTVGMTLHFVLFSFFCGAGLSDPWHVGGKGRLADFNTHLERTNLSVATAQILVIFIHDMLIIN